MMSVLTFSLISSEYIIQAAIKIEDVQLKWIVTHQSHLYQSTRRNVVEKMAALRGENQVIGKPIVCPASTRGSSRYWRTCLLKCSAMGDELGAATYFFTTTLNTSQEEIRAEMLRAGQNPRDAMLRTDIVSRSFKMRADTFIADFTSRQGFGRCIGYICVVEDQPQSGMRDVQWQHNKEFIILYS